VDDRLGRIEALLLLRDPGAGLAAEAYDGLCRQVAASAAQRSAHVADLAQMAVAAQIGESPATMALLVANLLARAGVETLADPARPDTFDVVAGTTGEVHVTEPAFIDGETGRIVRRGRAILIPAAVTNAVATATTPALSGSGTGRHLRVLECVRPAPPR
jgi:hypothetical protein